MTRCFYSTDPQAFKASLVNLITHDTNLWTRANGGPLPACSSSSLPPTNRCMVCVNQIVYGVCNGVVKEVELVMEAGGVYVPITESACPALRPDAHGSDVNPNSGLSPGAIVGIIAAVAVIVIIAILIYLFHGKIITFMRNEICRNNQQRPDPQAGDPMLDVEGNNGHVVRAEETKDSSV